MYSIDLSGKTVLIANVANKRSIAWAIAQRLQEAGARLALSHLNEREEEAVRPLVQESGWAGDVRHFRCDASSDASVEALFKALTETYGRIDALVHAMAFAPREALSGLFLNTTRDAFRIALEVSAYSFTRLMQGAAPLMTDGGSALTLTYMASERVILGYNVMGSAKAALEHAVRHLAAELGEKNIRVNAISAGPLNTLAARGVRGFVDMLQHHREHAPLRRNITQDEVAKAALFLLSDLGSGVTGETLHVDAGYNIMGM
ncbi:MAG: enoyl-ACP reductase [Candidatus Handelsmanbacteria bacterium RIFCSPLOWO2_12_FULL_64_10]|uniref:Enoyl-[acyl-carrier-protein] reductase [NADH] n=1 Tax=Handelsmanbacteria sp. (strain RIFCSPLOWO2_12_FULL_64_10) TaxID=1817868 RepID=A0A1F6CGJ3_HANXR|nr:MAG: enoyl-ACP reductase [Candidatus Handelsmanbacteria bacterium RIFCSPLOWO2_12_FULL_64_10]